MEAKVLAIALTPATSADMQEVESAVAEVDGGLVGSVRPTPERGVTFLAAAQWDAAMRELDRDLPWHTRRANVLVEADSLADLIGREVTVGAARLRITGETVPCGLMDKLCRDGLGIILTSSELPELLTVSDRILVLAEGRLTAEFSREEATEHKIMEAATLS